MTNLVGIIFPDEPGAHLGLQLLSVFEANGRLSLSSHTIATKDKEGAVSFKKVPHVGWTAAFAGALLGGIAGLTAGGVGFAAVGAAAGATTGRVADLLVFRDQKKFFDKVSRRLTIGSAAIVAEIEEYPERPGDSLIATIGGVIIRA